MKEYPPIKIESSLSEFRTWLEMDYLAPLGGQFDFQVLVSGTRIAYSLPMQYPTDVGLRVEQGENGALELHPEVLRVDSEERERLADKHIAELRQAIQERFNEEKQKPLPPAPLTNTKSQTKVQDGTLYKLRKVARRRENSLKKGKKPITKTAACKDVISFKTAKQHLPKMFALWEDETYRPNVEKWEFLE